MSKNALPILAASLLLICIFTCGCDILSSDPTSPLNEILFPDGSDEVLSNVPSDNSDDTPGPRTLTVLTEGQGTVQLNPDGGSYDPNTTVKLTARPTYGWRFSYWKTSAPNTEVWFQTAWNPAVVIMNRNKTVTAVFEIDPQATPTPTPTETPVPTPTETPTPTPTPTIPTTNPADQVAAPVITPTSRSFIHSLDIVMSCATPDADIRYTTDGSEPTLDSTRYTPPYWITETTHFNVKAFKSGMTPSDTVTADYSAISAGVLQWSFTTNDINISSPAIGLDGTVYFGSYDYNVYALNPGGSAKWFEPFTTGNNIYSSPAIGLEGTIYIGSDDGYLYALEPDYGASLWRFPDGMSTLGWVRSTPAIGSDGAIYFGSGSGKFYALNKDGTPRWQYPADSSTIGTIYGSATIGYDGTVFFGSWDHYVYALNPIDGSLRWRFDTGDYVESAPAIGLDGTLYIGSFNGKLFALDPETGEPKWTFQTATQNRIIGSCAVGNNGVVYFGSWDGNVYALDPVYGKKLWSYPTGAIIYSTPAVNFENEVLIGSFADKLHALNGSSGSLNWEFLTDGDVQSSPAVANNGTVYFTSWDHGFYAVVGAVPLNASSPWPMFQHDARHTGRATRYQAPPQITNQAIYGSLFTQYSNQVQVVCNAADENGLVVSVTADLSEIGGGTEPQALTYYYLANRWEWSGYLQVPSPGTKRIKFTAVDNEGGVTVAYVTVIVY